MADRDLVHQPANASGGLETGARPYDPPLLPYEIALIEALGCTEQEYREFVRHAQLQARIRPAEYAHIPDIQNDPVTAFVVNLVIGLALTAASVLLAPKAPALESPAKIKGKKLADQIGPTRFNQTTSFDNVSSLAEYGQPIPIPFGKRGTGEDGAPTGGLILAPALVWSRIYSYGNYQAFEGLYVAGEYGIETPKLAGIRLGTFALDTLGDREFAVFWSSTNGNNFPTALIAGTVGSGATGTNGRQVFTAPGTGGLYEKAASLAYNPATQYQFGTATPIHNGTAFRFNWEIVSAPFDSTLGKENVDARAELRAKRRKIAGKDADIIHDDKSPKVGMPGVGRAYSRRMGIVAVKRAGASSFEEYNNRTVTKIGINDIAVFEINKANWKDFQQTDFIVNDRKTDVNLKDLKSSAKSWRDRASDLLSIGSRWIIDDSIYVVDDRAEVSSSPVIVHIYLRCVAPGPIAELGIAGYRTVREPLAGYDGAEYNEDKHCGAAFWNICRLHMANIRPVRRESVAIEFGIRSQVWNKASGLCNFNAIPTPLRLFTFDKRNVSLNTPRMDKYFERASCFSVWVRPVSKYGEPEKQWARIPQLFCVIGRAPVDQYNYLRIKPRTAGYYEYRFVPRTGTNIAQHSIDTNFALQLSAEEGQLIGEDKDTPYGKFRVTITGKKVPLASIYTNEEMLTDPGEASIPTTKTGPSGVSQSLYSTNTANLNFVLHAWYWQHLGLPTAPNQVGTFTISMSKSLPTKKTLDIEVTVTADSGGKSDYVSTAGTTLRWTNPVYKVTDFSGDWNVNDKITHTIDTAGDNPFSSSQGYSTVNIQFTCSAIGEVVSGAYDISTAGRAFEQNSQLADCSHFLELTKSNENGPEHEIVYINEFVDNDTEPSYYRMSTVGLSIKSSGQVNAVDQIRIWSPTGISVYRLIERDTKPSNLFADLVYYLLTSKSQGVGNVVPPELIDTSSLRIAANFQRANKLFYDGVIEDSESFRSFLYDNAALQLCSFTIKNGRFGMMPALPYDSNYKITSNPIQIEQIFTSGNIIADSLQVQYIDAAQRSNFRALVSWRVTVENDLPSQASALVDWADIPENNRATTQQAFDLTEFCTNRAQALKTARFLLSVRRRVTHTVSFKTVPDALGIEPGSYIRVITAATTYSAANNGVITDAGTLVSVKTISNGTYNALVYYPSTGAIQEQSVRIVGNKVTDTRLRGTLFTLLSEKVNKGVYQVEQLTLDEDGLVNVSAVHVPVNAKGGSIVAEDVLTESRFRVLE